VVANILFGLAFSPKDIAYSGREVIMKNNGFAPKKTPIYRLVFAVIFLFVPFSPKREITFVSLVM
jgi:hypothetical protein